MELRLIEADDLPKIELKSTVLDAKNTLFLWSDETFREKNDSIL